MIFCEKCTECGYADDVIVPSRTSFEERLKREKCPKCGKPIEEDNARKWGSVNFSSTAFSSRSRHQDKRAHAANKRRKAKSDHAKAVKKDPYYDQR